ncbi:MAG: sigma-54 dependent transcriptional regulator [Spirochaetota bacterium]|nr:sigma-54 dependent transcriptional regulator [Spirochaetota bacterium]
MKKVLIIDDEKIIRDSYIKILKAYGFKPVESNNVKQALELFTSDRPSAVILDLKMPDADGVDVLQDLKKIDHSVPVIIVSAYGSIPTAVEAMKLGAYDFIPKPPDFDKLVVALQRAIENLDLKKQVEQLDSQLGTSLEWLMGKSDQIKKIIEQVNQIAQSDFSVILQGETGTGKTYIANIIHNLSKRANKPFVKVDIGAIPETLVESELFGHEKGSFTGADKRKKGLFEMASEGTLFIDELENMSSLIQSKLLTAVEDKQFYTVGGTTPINCDVRIITATNISIKKSVADGDFREDLLYRLGEFMITIPPLRERVEDIAFLAHKFFLEANADLSKHIKGLSESSLNILMSYEWRGNIRELKTVIRKAVLFADEEIRPEHIDFMNQSSFLSQKDNNEILPLKETVKNVERDSILKALTISQGNKSKAAGMLEVNYKTFLSKIKEYELEVRE